MKFAKKALVLMVVVLLVSTLSIPAAAATSTERSALNYSFTLAPGQLVGTSSNSMVRSTNGRWAVDVHEVSVHLPATYAMLWLLGSDWDYCLASHTEPLTGEGRVVGEYYNSNTVGWNLWLGVLFDANDPNLTSGLYSSGLWTTDAA